MKRGLLVLTGLVTAAVAAAAFVGAAGPSGAKATSHPYVAAPNRGYEHSGHR